MSTSPSTPDPTMDAISAAVLRGRDGDTESARRDLLSLWERIGAAGDAFHRCTLAHYLADLYDDPAESLVWNVRALDAADALTDGRAQRHHDTLRVAGFYPSLYLNLADDFRRLGSFRAAAEHLDRGQDHMSALPDDPYGDTIRTAVHEVRQAIADRDTAPRASAPGTAG
ncbi:hypothetical protein NJ76_07690 [Rhodococcus sp. IITR03]|uniref:hypothetical protein n=1 Tax=Rhodococcus pyridinivorans TaxID=103816 RepID=UPI000A454CB4|nr:hypothetical protein [Rhodococcus pyridinivorans]KLL96928.1 hypothetical protein NJ76_07690 [Rhodococcus sp. IITR03]WAL48089.1 hypothetical protein OQN32_08430 [Rhodococcus pyridinivorans]